MYKINTTHRLYTHKETLFYIHTNIESSLHIKPLCITKLLWYTSIMFKYICFQTVNYNFQVTSYKKRIHPSYKVDSSQFYTTWGCSKHAIIIHPFCYLLKKYTFKCDSRGTPQNSSPKCQRN